MENCFFCGCQCKSIYFVKDIIKKTFTNYDIIKCPQSLYACDECNWSFSSNETIQLIDGEIRENQSPRTYSWIITKDKKIAATKKHIKELREIILNPPEIPFKIILSNSSQKHLLFRLPWSQEKDNFYVQLEEESILVNIEKLKELLIIADKLSAVNGKMSLENCTNVNYAINIFKYYGYLTDYKIWIKIKDNQLAKLAIWLSKNKEEARNVYRGIDN